jgi:hypothetical protein
MRPSDVGSLHIVSFRSGTEFSRYGGKADMAGEKGGRFTVKLLGENVHLNKVSPASVRPALGSDLSRQIPQSGA